MLVFDRPLIYADVKFDNSQYDIAWTGEERWEVGALRKTGVVLREEDLPGLKSIIDNLVSSKEMAEERALVKKSAWANEGKSAEKIAEYMMKKYEQLTLGA